MAVETLDTLLLPVLGTYLLAHASSRLPSVFGRCEADGSGQIIDSETLVRDRLGSSTGIVNHLSPESTLSRGSCRWHSLLVSKEGHHYGGKTISQADSCRPGP